MTQPAVSTELVPAEPQKVRGPSHLCIVERPGRGSIGPIVSDGWVLVCPVAGIAVGTAIREFGIYGAAGSIVGVLVLAAGVATSKGLVVRAERRAAQFAARARLALPPGGSDA